VNIQFRPERRMLQASYIRSASAKQNPAANITPIGFKRRGRIANALKCVHAISKAATNLAMPGFDDWIQVQNYFA
jgi:hypothetical protein